MYGGYRNRIGIGLSYWFASIHRQAELIPWNQFLGSLKVKKFGLCLLCGFYPSTSHPPPPTTCPICYSINFLHKLLNKFIKFTGNKKCVSMSSFHFFHRLDPGVGHTRAKLLLEKNKVSRNKSLQ
jgi:hypothetical protein